MKFWNWFKKGDQQGTAEDKAVTHEENRETDEIIWATNAPPHWPPVSARLLIPEGAEAPFHGNLQIITFAAGLKGALEKTQSDLNLRAVAQTRLGREGLIDVPIEVEDRGQWVAVMLYPIASAEASTHFAAVSNFLQAR
jgi:hypothetical protein